MEKEARDMGSRVVHTKSAYAIGSFQNLPFLIRGERDHKLKLSSFKHFEAEGGFGKGEWHHPVASVVLRVLKWKRKTIRLLLQLTKHIFLSH